MATIGGKPVVPPTCPVDKVGFVPDLRQAPCVLWIEPHGGPPPRLLEVFVDFGHPFDDSKPRVTSDSLTLPIADSFARKIMKGVGMSEVDPRHTLISVNEHSAVAHIRDELCTRVVSCQGVVKGECWALGANALREVLNKVL